MSFEKPIPQVPGDDWHFQIQTLNQDGTPADLSGYTIIERSVEWGDGTFFEVDLVFSPGIADIRADKSDTELIQMGNVNSLTIKVQAPDTMQTTIIYKRIEGVRSLQAFNASTYIIGTQGPRGAMMLPGAGNPSNGMGNDGDLYIDITNGEMWTKAGGVWTDTGENIFGTIPEDTAEARDEAVAAAVAAGNSAFSAGASATTASNAAAAAAGSATTASNAAAAAGGSQTAAAGSASAAAGSATSAGTSATASGNSATAANASKVAAGISETNAAASAAAAIVAKITWRAAYNPVTAYVTRDAVSFGGSSWVNKLASTGNAPPTLPTTSNTWWDLLAQKGDVYEEYAVSIYKAANIDLGGYYAERSASASSTQTKLYGEIIAGDIGSQVDFYFAVNGVMAYGPVTAILGTPIDLSGLAIAVPAGAKVSYVVTYMTGNVSEFFAKSYGAVA